MTLLISRIGGYAANSKLKWIDFSKGSKFLEDGSREYRVNIFFDNFIFIWKINVLVVLKKYF